MKIVNYIERHHFWWNDLLTKSNCTEIQTYEVEFWDTLYYLLYTSQIKLMGQDTNPS